MKMNQWLVITGLVMVTGLGTSSIAAQDEPKGSSGRSSRWGDPEQFRQRILDSLKDRMRGMMSGRGPRPGGEGESSSDQSSKRGPRGGFGGEPSKEAEALQKAIDSKAPNSELKAALAKFLESRKAHQAALDKAQADL